MLPFFLLCLVNNTTFAQEDKNRRFEDKDIENFIPMYKVELPEVDVAKKKTGSKLPENNSSQRVAFLTDSIYRANSKLRYMEGYRIQVYSGSDRDEANKVKESIYKILPDADIYSVYKQPVYRIRLGDYTDRLTARRILEKNVIKLYPNAILVPDNVLIKRK